MLRFKKPAAAPAAAAVPAPTTEAAPSSSSSAETTTEAKPAESTEMEVEGEAAAPTEGGEAKVSLVGGIGGVKVGGQKKGKKRTPGELRVQKGKLPPSVPRRQFD